MLTLTHTRTARSQDVETAPPAPAAPRAAQIPQPVEKTLANGLRVIVVQKANVPLVAVRLVIKTGGEADPPNRAGLADMTATLLTKGTKTRTAEQIAQQVEALGATLETGAAWDNSFAQLSVLSSNLPQAMKYVADVVRNPTFTQEEIDRLREQNLDALRVAMRQPRALAGFVAARVIFGEGPYGHSLGGTPESLEATKREDVVAFHKNYYRPDNAILVFGGDIDPKRAFALAETQFGGWKATGAMPASVHTNAAPLQPRVVVVDLPEAGQAAVVVGRQGIRRVDPAYSVAQVANAVLGGGYSSRLNQEIRIKRGLSYGAGSTFELRRDVGPFTATTQTKNESAAEVAAIIVDELNRLGTSDVAVEELTPRKASLIGNFSRQLETSAGLVARIATLALYNVPLSEVNKYISGIEGVSAADVASFAKSHLAGSGASVVIVGDAKKFVDDLKKRFANVDVIPIAQFDINKANLRK